jgi:hypothetical protein
MQNNKKNLTNFILGFKVPEMMKALGFECFETNYMKDGKAVVVFEKEIDCDNKWKVEVDISNTIRCFAWVPEDDAPRWHQTVELSTRKYLIDQLKHWMLILHLSQIITLPEMLRLINENCNETTQSHNTRASLVAPALQMAEA